MIDWTDLIPLYKAVKEEQEAIDNGEEDLFSLGMAIIEEARDFVAKYESEIMDAKEGE